MPLYDLVCIARRTKPRAVGAAVESVTSMFSKDDSKWKEEIVKPLMKTAALHVLDNGGVVRGFQRLQTQELPYRMRRHQEIFSHGITWAMQFDASPSTMAGLRKALSFDERVIRYTVVKLGDSLQDCTGAYNMPSTFTAPSPSSESQPEKNL
ncbi:hypothetical protein BCR33DRAFT_676217 [Rhizoclosmatium globosum]|uniref:Ribosomal protein S6 n=1 Tax=Rhizoclosmatium globosum TaxID=329046 RepID=A0A1Y2CXD0_9FUNG|nr:hypothetical protein HDU79_001708 [Rhizoclosmatium sp. JEL0117]ORY51683.1 hypothetical protein BCR33DRAFT_676217 [Rhizoclosmatium globosum]|eukprot:ORY51683.1 hypothetical protein BCR33DRAFT_676217 [Rhizoclosmatium globosum]